MLRATAVATSVAFALAAPTVSLTYNAAEKGNLTVVIDGYPLVGGALPACQFPKFINGSGPSDWANLTFDAATHTYTTQQTWGVWSVQHVWHASSLTLDMLFSVTMFDDALRGSFHLMGPPQGPPGVVYPAAIIPPANLTGFTGAALPCSSGCWSGCGDDVTCTSIYPQALPMDWGTGALAFVRTDAPLPPLPPSNASLGFSFETGNRFYPFLRFSLLPAGSTQTAALSLRFGDGTAAAPPGGNATRLLDLAGDVMRAFAVARPFKVPVLPRGPLGVTFGSNCGASCTCKTYAPTDCPNPRGWYSDMVGNLVVNVTNPAGVAAFQAAALDWANRSVTYCLAMGAPGSPARCAGMLFWAIEGSEWTWDTYVGSPDMLPQIAPEMDGVVDALFRVVTAAGLKLGMTLRPQLLTPTPGWNGTTNHPQKYFQQDFYNVDNSTDVDAYVANIVRKATYAINRWGASMFYVDTCGNNNGVLPHTVWDAVTAALPGVLFFPEETDVLDYATVKPLQDNWPSAARGIHFTPPAAKFLWPAASNFQLLQFGLANNTPADFVPLIREGDALRMDAWFNESTSWDLIRAAYVEAGPE